MALTPEEEARKATYDRRSQAIVKATAAALYDGDEDTAWRDVFRIADEYLVKDKESKQPGTARIHIKAKH